MFPFRKIILIGIGAVVLIIMARGTYYAGITYRMIVKPQWYETINDVVLSQDGTIESNFNILKSDHGIEQYGGKAFANYIAGEQDSGWDFALIFNYQDKNNYYKLMASADRDELALWSAKGGFLAVQNIPISRFKWHALSVDIQNNTIMAQLDGASALSYIDNSQTLAGGSFGIAHYGNAVVFSKVPKFSLSSKKITAILTEKYTPNFRLIDWRNDKWIFDHQEPIAKVDSSELALYEVKLKKGYQPTGYWELFWKQYRGLEWYANKPISINQTPSDPDKLILVAKSATYDSAITSSVVMTVAFNNNNNSYEYDTDTSMQVNDGKTWDYSPESGLEYLNFSAYNTVAPAETAIKDAWQKNYEWILYTDSNNQWVRQPVNHIRTYEQSLANVDPYYGKYMYGVDEDVNPTIYLLNKSGAPQKLTQLCPWAFDAHFRWSPEVENNILESGAYYTAHYKITTTESVQAQKDFDQSILDPSFLAVKNKLAPIYRRTVNDFSVSRNLSEPFNEWIWSGNYEWDTSVGVDDSYSIRLERNDSSQAPKIAYVDTDGSSYFTRLEMIPAGKYVIAGYIKTENFSGLSPTVSIASKHPEGKPTIYLIDALPTTDGWQKFSFETYLPESTGINLVFSFEGEGKVWFDDVSWNLSKKDYFAPIKKIIQKVVSYIARRI